jgi:hypothetical protein
MTHTFTCNCGVTVRKVTQDWESYDAPARLPVGWGWGDRPLDAPVCPDCRKARD